MPRKPASADSMRAASSGGTGCSSTTRPFGIAGIGARAELHGEFVALRAGFDFRDDLGGLVEAQRQHAGGHRIERADVAGARGAVGLAHALQRAVRRQPLGLVEQDDAGRHGATLLDQVGLRAGRTSRRRR